MKRVTKFRWQILTGVLLALTLSVGAMLYARPLSAVDAAIELRLWQSGVQNKSITVAGHHVHYLEARSRRDGGTPILLIHGLGARAQDWAPLIPALVHAGYHVYAPDLLGYGETDAPDVRYSISDEEQFVAAFADAVAIRHADVVGWSMGGWIAMKLAADQPALVDRLVLYDSAGAYFARDYDASIFTPSDVAGVSTLVSRLTPRPVHMPRFLAADFLRRAAGRDWVIRRSVASMISGQDLMEFRFNQIHQPTLVIWGAEDRLIPPSSGERIAHGIPDATFVPIEGCGHLAPAECASQVLPPTLRFLERGAVPPQQQSRLR